MNQKPGTSKDAADKLVKGIKHKTRKQYVSVASDPSRTSYAQLTCDVTLTLFERKRV